MTPVSADVGMKIVPVVIAIPERVRQNSKFFRGQEARPEADHKTTRGTIGEASTRLPARSQER